ncbi:hypothetical protein ABZ897_00525 [Nonomuraea sp. NPDC046802]|uniref:hypothetical protein n=1 Tax=Nonomuraea sp. NPDC046802 TaxID=3154919 RepID=UPI00340A0A7B
MRKTHTENPGYHLTCACQWAGPCLNDPRRDGHVTCHAGVPLYRYETIVEVAGGQMLAAFRTPYRYPTASATGWHFDRWAMVWLADRRCRWQCTCDCGHPRQDIAHAPERNPMRPITYDVVPLFDLAGVS